MNVYFHFYFGTLWLRDAITISSYSRTYITMTTITAIPCNMEIGCHPLSQRRCTTSGCAQTTTERKEEKITRHTIHSMGAEYAWRRKLLFIEWMKKCSRCLSVRWKVDWMMAEKKKKNENNVHPNSRSSIKCLRQPEHTRATSSIDYAKQAAYVRENNARFHRLIVNGPLSLSSSSLLPSHPHRVPIKFNICLSISHLIIKCENAERTRESFS